MDTSISNLMMFPDEMLLEIYKYLSTFHIFYSFYDLNSRFNRCITDHCRHLSLADANFEQFHYLCQSILPKIGLQIRSLLLSDCRSVLEGKLFLHYFSNRMSEIFPHLENVTLICFTADELDIFLKTLINLPNLHQINIEDLLTDQSNLFERIVETNENRFHSIKFQTSCSTFPLNPCLNIRNLMITIPTLDKLSSLLAIIPNIQQLKVTVNEISMMEGWFDELLPLVYLKKFFLRCYHHYWLLEEIQSLLSKLPNVKYLSLQISSQDENVVNSVQKLFDILPDKIQQFNFCLRYYYDTIEEIDQNSFLKSRFPIICLIDDNLRQAILHTIPYRFPLLNMSFPMSKQMSIYQNYQNVQMFYDNHGMTLAETFPIISRCHQIKEIVIQCYNKTDESSSGT